MLTLSLQPGVSHAKLLVIMKAERRAGSRVAVFVLNLLKIAFCSFSLWDQGSDTTYYKDSQIDIFLHLCPTERYEISKLQIGK